MPLNRRETTLDGRHCAVENGITVRDDLLTALDVIATFSDGSLTPEFRFAYAMELMFPQLDEGNAAMCADLLPGLCWCLYGIDLTGEHVSECSGDRVFDWGADEDMIRASFLATYGMTIPEVAEKCSYKDACAMVGAVPRDTPMGQALFYRTAEEPERTEHNAEQVRLFRELRDHYALKEPGKDEWALASDRASAAFDALKGVRNG